jgi:hypothetical protein
MVQTQRHCRACKRKTLHARQTFSNAQGCLLTVLTLGLFLPFWMFIILMGGASGPWRCQQCGKTRWT